MDTRLWGPPCWETMHAITFTYPTDNPTRQQKHEMSQFFYALADVLPCYKCRTHFKAMLDEHSIENHLSSRDALTRWLVDRHNDVNRRLGKPQVPYDFVAAKYSNYYATNKCSGGAAVSKKQNVSTSQHDVSGKQQTPKKRKRVMAMIVLIILVLVLIAALAYLVMSRRKQ